MIFIRLRTQPSEYRPFKVQKTIAGSGDKLSVKMNFINTGAAYAVEKTCRYKPEDQNSSLNYTVTFSFQLRSQSSPLQKHHFKLQVK